MDALLLKNKERRKRKLAARLVATNSWVQGVLEVNKHLHGHDALLDSLLGGVAPRHDELGHLHLARLPQPMAPVHRLYTRYYHYSSIESFITSISLSRLAMLPYRI